MIKGFSTAKGLSAACAGLALAASAAAGTFTSALVGEVYHGATKSGADGGWTVSATVEPAGEGMERWVLDFKAEKPLPPPATEVLFSFPVRDVVARWHMSTGALPPNWGGRFSSTIYSRLPVVQLLSDSSENRALVACSEAFRRVNFQLGVEEESGRAQYSAVLFSEPEAPISSCRVEFLLDFRPVFYADAVRGATRWYESMPGLRPAAAPPAAFDPLYSFWYSYHQNVTAAAVERECAAAAKCGFKTIIVDDGWQTDDNRRGYRFCGDWQVSTNRFPDFRAHVAKVKAMGLKYMLWYALPVMGFEAQNHGRFKGKYLYDYAPLGYSVLDPRFPEVREFLIGTFERAVRDWGVDGLKLDFIDALDTSVCGADYRDPAVAEGYAGRDIKTVPRAFDRLMVDLCARLGAIRPGLLVEFRQSYVGPAIRKYGNMLRAGDCPADYRSNRVRTLDLRLTSGDTAVHSDMLMWGAADTPETASKQFWSVIFSVPQISVRLNDVPAAHLAKLQEALGFWTAHRDTLTKGELRPMRPDLQYPVVYAFGNGEQVVAVYDAAQVVQVDRAKGRRVFVVNATDADSLVVEEGGKARRVPMPRCSATELR